MQKLKFHSVFFLILIISFLLYVVIIFNGTPWGREQFKQDALKYLEKKYDQKMVLVSKVSYSFKSATYAVEASPKNMRAVKFAVGQSNQNKQEFYNTYFIEYWTYEANSDLNKGIKKVLNTDKITGRFIIQEVPDNLISKKVPPSFEEIKDKLKKGTYIVINFEKNFNTLEVQEEYKKLNEIINFIKQRNYQFDDMIINYNSTHNDRNVQFRLTYDELKNVKDTEDLIKYSNGLNY